VISGSTIILKDRQVPKMTDGLATATHPRTAVGLANGGRVLVILVDDGRWKEHSLGMSLPDLGKFMADLGCDDALNLDGGGSTEMALRDPSTGRLVVVNHPSDGHERPVANVLGVRIAGLKRVARPTTQPSARR
jgi:exopolysaccharide biosynthesis protein